LPFAAGSFQVPSSSGGHQAAVWVILAVILVAGIAAALIALVPRFRRLTSRRIRPHLLNIWANVKTIATEPRKLVYVLAGSTLAQLLVILALGASLHSVGQHVSIATLITVNTFAGLIGGAVPIPGGLGVVEAGLIAGLTAAGVPQDQAVAAVLIQRFFTSYLPRCGDGRPWPGCADANTYEQARRRPAFTQAGRPERSIPGRQPKCPGETEKADRRGLEEVPRITLRRARQPDPPPGCRAGARGAVAFGSAACRRAARLVLAGLDVGDEGVVGESGGLLVRGAGRLGGGEEDL
jgi:hypothetical protein